GDEPIVRRLGPQEVSPGDTFCEPDGQFQQMIQGGGDEPPVPPRTPPNDPGASPDPTPTPETPPIEETISKLTDALNTASRLNREQKAAYTAARSAKLSDVARTR